MVYLFIYPPKLLYQNPVEYMGVSKNSGFSLQIIHFNRVFYYKPSILGYHYFRKPPCHTSRVFWVKVFLYLQEPGGQCVPEPLMSFPPPDEWKFLGVTVLSLWVTLDLVRWSLLSVWFVRWFFCWRIGLYIYILGYIHHMFFFQQKTF